MRKKKSLRRKSTEKEEEEKISQKDGIGTNNSPEPKAVIFVPYTPNSELAKELIKVETVTHTGPEMALKLDWAPRPLAGQKHDHVTPNKAAEPITNQTPEPTENHVGGSHL